jgi:FdhD protein
MLGGIFVGGASSRMNGVPKGLMRTPDGETIVGHVARAMREAGLEPVLVGERPEYAGVGLRAIADAADAGPLGGLVALLEAARGERVVAIACDMPFVSAELVRKLAGAPDAPVVAPRRDGRWEPLFARYDASRVLEIAKARCARGELALQGLLDQVGATALEVDARESAALVDWDRPEDVGATALASATSERAVLVVSDESRSAKVDRVAVEEPLEIRSGRDAIAITMRTPGADADLAAGFLLGEGVVRARSDVRSIAPEGLNAVSVELGDAARARLGRAKRGFWSTSSCGICGKDSIDRIAVDLPPPARDATLFSPRAISRMPGALRSAQAVFDRTGGLHAAGLFDASGELVRLAEDVGRHNAVDKVIGAEFLAGRVPLVGTALALSGRVAFELVQKAAVAGVSAIVAIGAPTSLAVELAERAGVTLVGFARDGRFNVYAGASRVSST